MQNDSIPNLSQKNLKAEAKFSISNTEVAAMNGTKRSHGGAESAVKKAKFVLPTSDEQMQIQQSSLLANSNFLRLQVEEMLQSIQPDDSFEKKAPDWRKRFTDRVSSVSRDVALCSRKSIEKAGIQSDALSAYFESNDKLPALNIQSIGSHATDTMTAPFLNLDFLCFAPDVFFGQNDLSANGSKYFYKREYFVTCLLSFLKRPEFDDLIKQDTLTLALFKGDLDKHVLIFEPKGVKNATVRVYPAVRYMVLLMYVFMHIYMIFFSNRHYCHSIFVARTISWHSYAL